MLAFGIIMVLFGWRGASIIHAAKNENVRDETISNPEEK
jgi:hypothetical protein